MDVISVRNVEAVVASLRSKKVEGVVEDEVAAIDGVVAVDLDLGARGIVGLGDVAGGIAEPGSDGLVVLRVVAGVAVGCLAA